MKPLVTRVGEAHAGSLKQLEEEVDRTLVQAEKHQRACLKGLKEAGAMLLQIKAKVGHGNFGSWIEREFRYGVRMAQKLIQLHEGWDQLTASTKVDCLTLNQALDLLGKLKCAPRGAFDDGQTTAHGNSDPQEGEPPAGEPTPEHPSESDTETPPKPHDDNGQASGAGIPERLVPILAGADIFDAASRAALRAANATRAAEESEAYKALEAHELKLGARNLTKRAYSTLQQSAAEGVGALKPVQVCPDCLGNEPSADAEWCNRCGGKGFLIADDLAS
jgi:hypothetical protein